LISACRRLELDLYLSPCTEINSKWIKYLTIQPKTLKLLWENIRKALEDIGIGHYFLARTSSKQVLVRMQRKGNPNPLLA
jgi:hypothetical protein